MPCWEPCLHHTNTLTFSKLLIDFAVPKVQEILDANGGEYLGVSKVETVERRCS